LFTIALANFTQADRHYNDKPVFRTGIPWFMEAKIADILNVVLLHDFHPYWPSLDVDLDLSSLEDLSETPLMYQ